MAKGKAKSKGKKKSKKGKKKAPSASPVIVAPPPVVLEKPKPKPCIGDCPVYFIYDTCRRDLDEKIKKNLHRDGLLYFKNVSEALKMYAEWRRQAEEEKMKNQMKLQEVLVEIEGILALRELEQQRELELKRLEEERRAKLFDIDFTEIDKFLEKQDKCSMQINQMNKL